MIDTRARSPSPSLAGIRAAAARLVPHLSRTPLYRSEALSRALGADVWLKVETTTAIASFKVRGALNHLLLARDAGQALAAVASSTGNHGQGVALAARMLGIPAHVFLPEGCEPVKTGAIAMLGAHLHEGGRDIDDAKERARDCALLTGSTFVDDGESIGVIEGAGTVGLEAAEALDNIDRCFVPMGSGSLAAGAAIAIKGLQPGARVVAVQSQGSSAMVESWKARRAIERPVRPGILADCLVCRVPAAASLAALIRHVDDARLVDDASLLSAMRAFLDWGHLLVEPGAAAGLAAAWAQRDVLRGRRILVIVTGANVGPAAIARAAAAPLPAPAASDDRA